MGLPPELLPYAENLFRRFPEEFIALGAPHLEDIFDLRSEGTWSRRIVETATDKTIEIVLRRRHPPCGPPPAAPPHHAMPGYGNYWQNPVAMSGGAPPGYPGGMHGSQVPMYGVPPQTMAYPHGAPSPQQDMDDQTAMRLVHLENQLQALKPQVQAALMSQTMPSTYVPPAPSAAPPAAPTVQQEVQQQQQQQPQQPQQRTVSMSPKFRPPPLQVQHHHNTSAVQMLPKTKKEEQSHPTPGDESPTSLLRQRRNIPALGIGIQKASQPTHPTIQPLNNKNDPVPAAKKASAPVKEEPQSPRSPGKYSVWKTDWSVPANSVDSKRPAPVEAKPQAKADAKPDKPNRPNGVNVMRVAKSSDEPESPRSPGRYSVWKTDWTVPPGNSPQGNSKRPAPVEVKPQANADAKPDKPNRPNGVNVTRVAKSKDEPESPRSPGRYNAWSSWTVPAEAAPKAKPNRPDGLNVTRVAKSREEPESPRSPGRFTAWK